MCWCVRYGDASGADLWGLKGYQLLCDVKGYTGWGSVRVRPAPIGAAGVAGPPKPTWLAYVAEGQGGCEMMSLGLWPAPAYSFDMLPQQAEGSRADGHPECSFFSGSIGELVHSVIWPVFTQ